MRTYTKTVVSTLALLVFFLLGPAVASAYAVTLRDLVALSKEGVSDAVLIALIETDGSRFQLTPEDVRGARAQGLSDAVIIAMIRTRPLLPPVKTPAAAPVAPAPVPDREPVIAPPPPPQTIIVQAPPVTVTQTVTQRVELPYERVEQVPVYVPVYVPVPTRPVEVKKEEPVYWGWGGKRRPDAWPEPVIIK
jgi:hypothetical protein